MYPIPQKAEDYTSFLPYSVQEIGVQFMVPCYKRRANLRWDRRNLVIFGCKLKRLEAQAFQAYCEEMGKTPYAVVRELILGCIREK